MAQNYTVNDEGFIDKRLAAVPGGVQAGNTWAGTFTTNTKDLTSMRARLTAISAAYTPAQLDKMTVNDMVYAIRLADEPGSI